MTALAFAAVTFFSTEAGGLLALYRRRYLALVMGAAAGLLFGSALIDLLPDAVGLVAARGGGGILSVALAASAGFLLFRFAEKAGHDSTAGEAGRGARAFGAVAALGLTVHSFMDGMAIGTAFEHSAALGTLVGIAVVAHDFGDGVSTVGVVLGSRAGLGSSLGWLLADAVAPFAGALSARNLHLSQGFLAALLAFFAGTFLFVGASHLLPRALREGRKVTAAAAAVAGFAFIGAATWILDR